MNKTFKIVNKLDKNGFVTSMTLPTFLLRTTKTQT